MKFRCSNPKDAAYKRYGGRGIQVCQEWRDSFIVFRDWAMANGYEEHLTIDRYPDKNGNYEPGNCRWATYKEQSRNRNYGELISYKGKKLRICELAEQYGLPPHVVKDRIRRDGWAIDEALSTPVIPRSGKRKNAA